MLKLHLHIFLKGAFNTSTQVNIDLVQLIVFYLYKQKYKTTFGCEKAHSNKIITHSPNTSLSFNPHLWPLSFGWPSPVFFFLFICADLVFDWNNIYFFTTDQKDTSGLFEQEIVSEPQMPQF